MARGVLEALNDGGEGEAFGALARALATDGACALSLGAPQPGLWSEAADELRRVAACGLLSSVRLPSGAPRGDLAVRLGELARGGGGGDGAWP
eukprot:3419738-Prymnesium_polylepis.1